MKPRGARKRFHRVTAWRHERTEIMTARELQESAHRRWNPLTREWVLVSPHRTQRPWGGRVEAVPVASALAYDPSCYLCPGNERSGGKRNPQYKDTFVFENDFPALLRDAPEFTHDDSGLLVARSETGACRVVCFSPRHDLTMARMAPAELQQVVGVWADECAALEKLRWVRHIQIFENRGALMGASNPHPHCQIWANASLPNEPEKELASLRQYHEEKHSCLLCDYLQLELKLAERIVFENDGFVVLVPYWAIWPFETLLLSKRHLGAITELSLGRTRPARRMRFAASRFVTTIYSAFRFHARWDSTSVPAMARRIPNGIFTRITIRRFCARRLSRNSSWDTNCWRCRSATLRRKALRNGCARRGNCITSTGIPRPTRAVGERLEDTQIPVDAGEMRGYRPAHS